MNPKSSPRVTLTPQFRAVFGPASNQAVYSRCTPYRPGYYIIRLRLQHSQTQFRPRLKFL